MKHFITPVFPQSFPLIAVEKLLGVLLTKSNKSPTFPQRSLTTFCHGSENVMQGTCFIHSLLHFPDHRSQLWTHEKYLCVIPRFLTASFPLVLLTPVQYIGEVNQASTRHKQGTVLVNSGKVMTCHTVHYLLNWGVCVCMVWCVCVCVWLKIQTGYQMQLK